jgi:hypothetical protein
MIISDRVDDRFCLGVLIPAEEVTPW